MTLLSTLLFSTAVLTLSFHFSSGESRNVDWWYFSECSCLVLLLFIKWSNNIPASLLASNNASSSSSLSLITSSLSLQVSRIIEAWVKHFLYRQQKYSNIILAYIISTGARSDTKPLIYCFVNELGWWCWLLIAARLHNWRQRRSIKTPSLSYTDTSQHQHHSHLEKQSG